MVEELKILSGDCFYFFLFNEGPDVNVNPTVLAFD
jgi:hypothetical protein